MDNNDVSEGNNATIHNNMERTKTVVSEKAAISNKGTAMDEAGYIPIFQQGGINMVNYNVAGNFKLA